MKTFKRDYVYVHDGPDAKTVRSQFPKWFEDSRGWTLAPSMVLRKISSEAIIGGSAHIAGVINPPAANKYGYRTRDALAATADVWLEGASHHEASWWPHWGQWVAGFAGKRVAAREPGDGVWTRPAPRGGGAQRWVFRDDIASAAALCAPYHARPSRFAPPCAEAEATPERSVRRLAARARPRRQGVARQTGLLS